jgi:uracil phosphoribosyltransferase
MIQPPQFPNLYIVDHPLVQHKLSYMRQKDTSSPKFRELLREISILMGYEVTRSITLKNKTIETPLKIMNAPFIDGQDIVIVPILRAGIGMVDGLLELVPTALIGHIGLYRDPKTKRPVEYLVKLPEPNNRIFIVVDPMIGTGYSAAHAINILHRHGIPDSEIRFMALVAAPEGIKVFHEQHPNIPLFTAALDERLDKNAYIIPGLGDAGDRLFGTH